MPLAGFQQTLSPSARFGERRSKNDRVSSGTELVRPFMPAKDFELSKRSMKRSVSKRFSIARLRYSMPAQVGSSCNAITRKIRPITS